jgi:hypothetical protein
MASTPSTVPNEDFHDGIDDIVSTDLDVPLPTRVNPTTTSTIQGDPNVSDFQEKMIEVYGPTITSQISVDTNLDPTILDDPTVLQGASTQTGEFLVSEERANNDVARNNELQQSTIDENLDQLVETMVEIAHANCAVTTTTEDIGDDRYPGPPVMGNPDSSSPIRVTQDVEEYNGSNGINPVVIGNEAIYIQEHGHVVSNIGYQFAQDSFVGSTR